MPKTLVLYYSYEGSTKKIADIIAEEINADIEAVKFVKTIKTKGFGKFIWGGRQVVMGKKPEILPLKSDLAEYELVLIGSPIWAGTFAPPIKTLLETGLMKDKKVGYFYTHDGGASKALEKGKEAIEIYNTFESGIEFVRVSKALTEKMKSDAKEWAKSF